MSIYEIINPSDKVLIQSDSFEAAALAALMAGDGKFGLHEVGGESRQMPMFIMGGTEKWFIDHFGFTQNDSIKTIDKEILAAAFDSARVGDIQRTKEESKAATTSLNDIAGYCWQCADAIRHNIKNGVYDASEA